MIEQLTILHISILCSLAFCAGLIQIPALFNVLPAVPEAALLGTNKLAAVSAHR